MNQIKRSAVITALISTSLYTTTAFAHSDDKHTIEELESTTAIARRANQLIEIASSTIYSMEPDALRSIGILNLTDALEQLPGVIIASSGQQGVRQAIRLRGLRSGDVQLRIDGIRLSNRLANQSIFSANTALNGLSKIELIQGGQAALYGGGSTAGVISLTTKRGTSDMKNRFSLEAGSFNSLSLETERGGRWKELSYYLSTKYSTTDNDTFGGNSEAGGFDNDSLNQNSALRLGYDLRDDLELGLTFRSNLSETETPQFGGSRVESDFYLGTIYADYQVTDKLHSKFTFSYLTENTDFGGGSGANYDQFGIVLENSYQYSGSSSLNFGVEYENQDYSGYGTPNG
jgi:outer membrane cobalamin receptor